MVNLKCYESLLMCSKKTSISSLACPHLVNISSMCHFHTPRVSAKDFKPLLQLLHVDFATTSDSWDPIAMPLISS
jgi:hypothetical protein